MHPDIAQALAEAHLSDLRREADRQRLARSARTRRVLALPGDPWRTLRAAVGRLTVGAPRAQREPDCCPA